MARRQGLKFLAPRLGSLCHTQRFGKQISGILGELGRDMGGLAQDSRYFPHVLYGSRIILTISSRVRCQNGKKKKTADPAVMSILKMADRLVEGEPKEKHMGDPYFQRHPSKKSGTKRLGVCSGLLLTAGDPIVTGTPDKFHSFHSHGPMAPVPERSISS